MSERRCLVCGDAPAEMHHALPKGAWPDLRDHPAVLIPLCFFCHSSWHMGRVLVYREDLPAATRELVEGQTSSEWADRWYPHRPHPTPF